MVNRAWLATAQSVLPLMSPMALLPDAASSANLMILVMRGLSEEIGSPDEFDDLALGLIVDGVWGQRAQAAYAMLVHICETGEVPNDDSTQTELRPPSDDDSDVMLDPNANDGDGSDWDSGGRMAAMQRRKDEASKWKQ